MSERTGEPEGDDRPTGDDEVNDEPGLTTRIDGEEVRLLVHIEPLDEGDGPPSDPAEPGHASRADPPASPE